MNKIVIPQDISIEAWRQATSILLEDEAVSFKALKDINMRNARWLITFFTYLIQTPEYERYVKASQKIAPTPKMNITEEQPAEWSPIKDYNVLYEQVQRRCHKSIGAVTCVEIILLLIEYILEVSNLVQKKPSKRNFHEDSYRVLGLEQQIYHEVFFPKDTLMLLFAVLSPKLSLKAKKLEELVHSLDNALLESAFTAPFSEWATCLPNYTLYAKRLVKTQQKLPLDKLSYPRMVVAIPSVYCPIYLSFEFSPRLNQDLQQIIEIEADNAKYYKSLAEFIPDMLRIECKTEFELNWVLITDELFRLSTIIGEESLRYYVTGWYSPEIGKFYLTNIVKLHDKNLIHDNPIEFFHHTVEFKHRVQAYANFHRYVEIPNWTIIPSEDSFHNDFCELASKNSEAAFYGVEDTNGSAYLCEAYSSYRDLPKVDKGNLFPVMYDVDSSFPEIIKEHNYVEIPILSAGTPVYTNRIQYAYMASLAVKDQKKAVISTVIKKHVGYPLSVNVPRSITPEKVLVDLPRNAPYSKLNSGYAKITFIPDIQQNVLTEFNLYKINLKIQPKSCHNCGNFIFRVSNFHDLWVCDSCNRELQKALASISSYIVASKAYRILFFEFTGGGSLQTALKEILYKGQLVGVHLTNANHQDKSRLLGLKENGLWVFDNRVQLNFSEIMRSTVKATTEGKLVVTPRNVQFCLDTLSKIKAEVTIYGGLHDYGTLCAWND